jgi:LPXTG-motif cell wall-anchored protein
MALGLSAPANAQEVPCGTPAISAVYKTVVVPATETVNVVHHPEVSHTVHHDAVTHNEEKTVVDSREIWANWSPNHTHGPQDYTPVWPHDPRGTWHVHHKIPKGHAGPDGVYQRDKGGNGNSDWFYRQAEKSHVVVVVVVDKEAYDEVVVDAKAYDENVVTTVPATSKRVLVSAAVPAGPPCTVTKSTTKRTLVRERVAVVGSPEATSTVVADAPDELAMTGSDNVPLGIAGGSMLLLGGLAYALRRRLNRP